MKNNAIAGWRVKNRTENDCHVFDIPDDYRSVTIPVNATGTLTGDVMVFPEGVNEQECYRFAADAERIKQALSMEILSNQQEAVQKGLNYWQQTKKLSGDGLIASRVALIIKWDGIYEHEPETLKCGSYIPWLELLEQ